MKASRLAALLFLSAVWPEPPCKDFGTRTDNAYKAVPAK